MKGAPHVKHWVEGPVRVSYRRGHFETTRFYRQRKINPTFIDVVGEGREAARWMPASERITERTQWSADIFRQIREIMAAIAAADASGQSEIAEYRLATFSSMMSDAFGQRLAGRELQVDLRARGDLPLASQPSAAGKKAGARLCKTAA